MYVENIVWDNIANQTEFKKNKNCMQIFFLSKSSTFSSFICTRHDMAAIIIITSFNAGKICDMRTNWYPDKLFPA